MNALEVLRRADPARSLPAEEFDSSTERLLQEITATQHVDRTLRPVTVSSPRRVHSLRPEWKPILVTVAVAALLSGVTVAVFRSVPAANQHQDPAATTSIRTGLEAALYATLPAGARSAPGLTYSDVQTGAQGDGFDTTGRTLLLSAACDGGGTITVTVSGSADRTLNCSTLSTLGPINLSADLDTKKGISVNVTAGAGHPQYLAKVAAILTQTSTPSGG